MIFQSVFILQVHSTPFQGHTEDHRSKGWTYGLLICASMQIDLHHHASQSTMVFIKTTKCAKNIHWLSWQSAYESSYVHSHWYNQNFPIICSCFFPSEVIHQSYIRYCWAIKSSRMLKPALLFGSRQKYSLQSKLKSTHTTISSFY